MELENQLKKAPKNVLETLVYARPDWINRDSVNKIGSTVVDYSITESTDVAVTGFHTQKFPFFNSSNGAWVTGGLFWPVLILFTWGSNGLNTYVRNYVIDVYNCVSSNNTNAASRYLFKRSSFVDVYNGMDNQPSIMFADKPIRIQPGNVTQIRSYIERNAGITSNPTIDVPIRYVLALYNDAHM